MRVSRWITAVLLLTAALAYVKATDVLADLKETFELGDPYPIPDVILEPRQAEGKHLRVAETDTCEPRCIYFYPAEKPRCVNPPPNGIKVNPVPDPCPCGVGLGDKAAPEDCRCATPPKTVYQSTVQKLADEIKVNTALRIAFDMAIKDLQKLNVSTAQCITSTNRFLSYADQILKTPPYQSGNSRNVYNTLATFYLVLDMPSLKVYQSPVIPGTTACGTTQQQLTFLSEWIREFAIAWGTYLDTDASANCVETFKTDELYCWNDFIEPLGGYRTFNEYFSRYLKPGVRPIYCKCNPDAVVFPTDSTYVATYDISSTSTIDTGYPDEAINVKGAVWSIHELLFLSHYRDCFAGGKFTHAFLSTYNYHRWHAPVSGTIVERRVIAGQFYLSVTVTKEKSVTSMPYVEDNAGYQFVQQRGLVTIKADNPNIGYVVAMPIGMAQVSGISFTVKVGDHVNKGDELGTFLFGGSDFVVVFQKKANFYPVAPLHRQSYMGELYGWAGPPPKDYSQCLWDAEVPLTDEVCPESPSPSTEETEKPPECVWSTEELETIKDRTESPSADAIESDLEEPIQLDVFANHKQ